MGTEPQDRIPDIVVMGDLHLVEQDDVLQFGGVADHRAGADQGAAPDKGLSLIHI